MSKSNKIMIQVCLCGAGTKKAQAPTVPYTADELAEQIVACAKAGASIAHIHVREDKVVDGEMQIGYKSMSLQKFTEAVEKTRELCAKENVDIIINLTTSGGEYEDQKRLQHLAALHPEMCSFDPNTLNWSNSYIFENSPRFLNLLSQEVVKEDVKPEFEVLDTGEPGLPGEQAARRGHLVRVRHWQGPHAHDAGRPVPGLRWPAGGSGGQHPLRQEC